MHGTVMHVERDKLAVDRYKYCPLNSINDGPVDRVCRAKLTTRCNARRIVPKFSISLETL